MFIASDNITHIIIINIITCLGVGRGANNASP
jgi:hypothetical protein